ncbi:DUF4145 domain-containing protein [Methylophilus flavus]|uniref:DUF4145 domain-containing protein n=1 Tax=Methylophilus flavus TaxID=640084 RepID=A0ABW3P8L8_9PROT
MKCPHCLIDFHNQPIETDLGKDGDGFWHIEKSLCPACNRFVMILISTFAKGVEISRALVRPKAFLRPSLPKEVPPDFAFTYNQAAAVIAESPMASAALSRRCLQHLIRDVAGIKKRDLAQEIDDLIGSNFLPTYLSDAVDAVRIIGNFAAHPIKATATGEILPVEPGEAEWTLDVLDGLFDFYFVQPERLREKREALNAKLSSASKPQLK